MQKIGMVEDKKGYDWGVEWDSKTHEIWVAYPTFLSWEWRKIKGAKASTAAIAAGPGASTPKKRMKEESGRYLPSIAAVIQRVSSGEARYSSAARRTSPAAPFPCATATRR